MMGDALTVGAERLAKIAAESLSVDETDGWEVSLAARHIASDPGVRALVERVKSYIAKHDDATCDEDLEMTLQDNDDDLAALKLWEHGDG